MLLYLHTITFISFTYVRLASNIIKKQCNDTRNNEHTVFILKFNRQLIYKSNTF